MKKYLEICPGDTGAPAVAKFVHFHSKKLRKLVALLNLSSWFLVMVERLFLAVPRGCLWFVIVVFPDHTHDFRTF